MLTAAFVPFGKLQSGTTCLIEVKSLTQESFSHLVADLVCSIYLIVRGFVHLGPFVEILLQVALLHDFGPSIETGTTRTINLLLLLLDLLRQVFDLRCKIAPLFLHFHDHGGLHLNLLTSLAPPPEVKGVSQARLPPPDDHVLQPLIDHDGCSRLDILPLVEVLGNVTIDHGLDRLEASVAT